VGSTYTFNNFQVICHIQVNSKESADKARTHAHTHSFQGARPTTYKKTEARKDFVSRTVISKQRRSQCLQNSMHIMERYEVRLQSKWQKKSLQIRKGNGPGCISLSGEEFIVRRNSQPRNCVTSRLADCRSQLVYLLNNWRVYKLWMTFTNISRKSNTNTSSLYIPSHWTEYEI
jgi:hypothetical protein